MFGKNEGVAVRIPHSVPQIESEHFGLLCGFWELSYAPILRQLFV
jgi:hypothetical protein